MDTNVISKRTQWLDVSRVLCMLMIVTMHFRPNDIEFISIHAWCHAGVPFYLFWAGYFCAGSHSWKKIFHRCVVLISVFITWEILAYALGFAGDQNTSFIGIGQFLVVQTGFGKNYPYIGPLWFIRDLIFLTAFTPLIVKGRIVLIPVILGMLCYSQLNWTHEPETFLSIGTCIIYMLGCWSRPYNIMERLEQLKTKQLVAFLLITGVMIHLIVLKNAYLTGSSWSLQIWEETVPGYIIGTMLISTCGILIMRFMPAIGKKIATAAPAMLFVLALHCPLGNAIGISHWFSGLLAYLQAPVLLGICLGIYFFIKKLIPGFVPYLSGNRN